jgi:hypothetical protein
MKELCGTEEKRRVYTYQHEAVQEPDWIIDWIVWKTIDVKQVL